MCGLLYQTRFQLYCAQSQEIKKYVLLFVKSNKPTQMRHTYLYTDLTAVNKSSVPR